MIRSYSHLIANGVVHNKHVFGLRTTYDKVVGMVPPPLNEFAHRDIRPDANMFAFNPMMGETKLKVRCQDLLKKIPGKSKTISPGQSDQRRFESIQRLLRRRKLRKHRLQT